MNAASRRRAQAPGVAWRSADRLGRHPRERRALEVCRDARRLSRGDAADAGDREATACVARVRTGHLQRKNVLSNFEMEDWRSQTIVSLVERAGPTRVFTIGGSQREARDRLATARLGAHPRHELGAIDASEYFRPGAAGSPFVITRLSRSRGAVAQATRRRAVRCVAVPRSTDQERRPNRCPEAVRGAWLRGDATEAHRAGGPAAAGSGTREEAV